MLTSFYAGSLLWDLKLQPYMPIILGLWFRLNLPWMLLVAIEFRKSSDGPMVLFIATRRVWLRVVSLNMRESTTQKPSVLLLNQLLFGSFLPLLYLTIIDRLAWCTQCLPQWFPLRGCLYATTHEFYWPYSTHSCLSPSQVSLWFKTSFAGLVHTTRWLSSIDWLSHFQGWCLLIYSDCESWYLLVYIDDILLTGNNSTLLPRFISLLSSEFKI